MTRKNRLDKSWLLEKFCGRLFYYEEIDSTMTQAKRLINKHKLQDGTLLLAETQAGGKGRRGRVWYSEKGGIWLTYVVIPKLSREDYTLYSIMTAVALQECLEKYKINSKIKWPNDIIIQDKKLAGIAIDLVFKGKDTLVIGLGINVYNSIIDIATRVSDYNEDININEFFTNVVDYLDQFKDILEKNKDKILDSWRESNNVLGKEVKIIPANGNKPYFAKAIDINENGSLIVNKDGDIKSIFAADVSLRIS